ncbi:SGNH/GDSL hydrolase family protein [Mycetocola zhujimingii]|uniref:SGNH hydrolase-type esterase domain-containing protein n=1 Tax=Mycetocola zhujimingii TaxID=2079792 RepID=A0A2U1TG04_9MICO|nr:SGNH/GDSL hydrolase family protein [Mycetocola zhujimingii]PWC07822.1 hypothetical protein DF223_00160 [Mycetocola zhujimingii]
MERVSGAGGAERRAPALRSGLLLKVAVPAVLAAMLAGAFFTMTPRPAAAPAAVSDAGSGTNAGASSLTLASFADAMDRIDDNERTFVAQVIGDSTGNEQGEWVDLAFRELALRLDRPLVQHPWDVLSSSYLAPITFNAEASNAPLIVWNGSASGKTAAYSLTHIDALVPGEPDLVILNHGLNNVLEPAQVGEQFTSLIAGIEQRWPATIGYAALLENPRLDQHAAAHDEVIGHVAGWLAEHQTVRPIDVHSAYLESGDVPALLLPDLLHPAPVGSALTAATVISALTR